MEQNLKLKFLVQEFVEIWHNFCHEHTQIFDLTCDEYISLLASDLEKIEEIVEEKNQKIQHINQLDQKRLALMQEISEHAPGLDLTKFKTLISHLESEKLYAKEAGQLRSLNSLLLDIIEKTQEQNRKNQFFLNRAILSLKELKEGFTGKNLHSTYSADGKTRAHTKL